MTVTDTRTCGWVLLQGRPWATGSNPAGPWEEGCVCVEAEDVPLKCPAQVPEDIWSLLLPPG
jgi:hypothetical protein